LLISIDIPLPADNLACKTVKSGVKVPLDKVNPVPALYLVSVDDIVPLDIVILVPAESKGCITLVSTLNCVPDRVKPFPAV
jgi:hypothetical protein